MDTRDRRQSLEGKPFPLRLQALAAVAAVLIPCSAGAATNGNSLKILSYNVGLLPAHNPANHNGDYHMGTGERAERLAAGILKTDADVVGLVEVMAEDATQAFIDKLSPTYPHYVSEVTATNDSEYRSGLMIFSRHPFSTLGNDDFTNAVLDPQDLAFDHRGTASDDQIGFVLFEDWCLYHYTQHCVSNWDANANKGAAIVRVLKHGVPWNVIVTHMQAGYGSDDEQDERVRAENRHYQMRSIEDLILGSVVGSEPILLVGDLNIDGNLNRCKTPDGCEQDLDGINPEWEWHFSSTKSYNDPDHGYFACGNLPCGAAKGASRMIDGWYYSRVVPGTGSKSPHLLDVGQTHGGKLEFLSIDEGRRLDYLIYDGTSRVCPQHTRIATEVRDPSGWWFSDHLPLYGDFNTEHSKCSPRRSHPVTFPGQDTHIPSDIADPGSMQWYRIDQAGTYSIKAGSSGVFFRIYHASDLSRPIKQYHNELTRWGAKFNLNNPPYYVRAYASNPLFTGSFSMLFHRHECRTAEDACALTPALANTDGKFPGAMQVNQNNTLWYSFYTNTSERSEYPDLTLMASPLGGGTYTLEVLSGNGPYTVQAPVSLAPPLLEITGLDGQSNGKDRRYYFRVTRNQVLLSQVTMLVHFQTNLTYFYPQTLSCVNEQDALSAEDEIYAVMDPDGTGPTYGIENYGFFSIMDEGAPGIGAAHLGPRRFLRELWPNLLEEGGGEDEVLAPLQSGSIPALQPGQVGGETVKFTWSQDPDLEETNYWYELTYKLRHESE